MVSKYLIFTSDTVSEPGVHSTVTLYTSPYSDCARKKNCCFVRCVALETMRTPRSPESDDRRGMTARTSACPSFL
eukprot:31494-Pelagococcus_subviridis.AAC.26